VGLPFPTSIFKESKMIDKIKEVLKSFQNTQANLDSDSTIEVIAQKINESINQDLEIERMKLSEQIVEHYEEGYIFESPDGGKTVWRRDFGDYDPKNKIEIDWETKKPTGRNFTQYREQYIREMEACGTQDIKMYPWHNKEGDER
tara:strand:+ start:94 stop:528 length:435 start_codon:yes stop_codon:yes gene_type:complete